MCIPGLAPREYIEKNKGKRGPPSTEITWGQVSKCRFSLVFDSNSLHLVSLVIGDTGHCFIMSSVLYDNRCVNLMACTCKFKDKKFYTHPSFIPKLLHYKLVVHY